MGATEDRDRSENYPNAKVHKMPHGKTAYAGGGMIFKINAGRIIQGALALMWLFCIVVGVGTQGWGCKSLVVLWSFVSQACQFATATWHVSGALQVMLLQLHEHVGRV